VQKVRVIGVGTRHGDDAVGLEVAAALAGGPLDPRIEVLQCAQPATALLDALESVAAAVIVDATRCGLTPGTVHEPSRAALGMPGSCSSHGFGVAETLALAEALGRLPEQLAIVGVEAQRLEGDTLSPAVAGSVAPAAERVHALATEFAAGGDPRA